MSEPQAAMMDTGYFEHHTSSEQVRLDIVSRCFAVAVVACQRVCDYWCERRAPVGHGRAASELIPPARYTWRLHDSEHTVDQSV